MRLLGIGLAAILCASASAAEVGDYVKDGELKKSITLKDEQGGIVGFTGDLYTIESSGKWSVARFVNEKVDKPHASGTLDKKAIEALGKLLADKDFAKLPGKFGRMEGANPRVVTLAFGDQKSVLTLNAGEDFKDAKPDKGDKNAEAWEKFKAVALKVQELCPKEKK